MVYKHGYFYIFLFLVSVLGAPGLNAQKKFTIVLDAGHGGKDNGAESNYSDLGTLREKDITLEVTMLVGKMLEKDKDNQVIYTRKTDIYSSLGERTDLANKSKADLFISIHCNSASNSSAYGTETFVQGPNQNSTNLEVAKRENEVIFFDENDRVRFSNYQPSSSESLIALKLQQQKYLEKSLTMGSLLENNFVNKLKIFSRGVKQKDLHVLRMNAMPSVLVEIGFISNYEDAHRIGSPSGQKDVAENIYNAILDYKKYYNRNSKSQATQEKLQKTNEASLKTTARILLTTSPIKYFDNDPALKGLNNITIIKEGVYYKYYYGTTNYASVRDENMKTAKNAGFRSAYPVNFTPNQKLSSGYYTLEITISMDKLPKNSYILKTFPDVEEEKIKNMYYYTYGRVGTLEEALALQKKFMDKGIKNTVIQRKP